MSYQDSTAKVSNNLWYCGETMAELSAWQRWWMGAWPHRLRVFFRVPQFLRVCPMPFRGEVLEVGAGKGWTSRRILETFPQVELTAVDVDQAVVETFDRLIHEYGNRLHVQQANAEKLPFDRSKFDFVLAINVMGHLTEKERQDTLLECLRVLKPGGLLGMSEAFPFVGSHEQIWEELKRSLADEDCEVVYASTKRGFDVWARKGYQDTGVSGGAEA